VTAGAHTVSFVGLDTAGGDNTAFLDAISLAIAPSGAPTIADAGFEVSGLSAGTYQYAPAGSGGRSSRARAPTIRDQRQRQRLHLCQSQRAGGSQVALLQANSAIAQQITGTVSGTYTISLYAAQRAVYNNGGENFEVLIDGVVVATINPSTTTYLQYTTSSFSLSAGTHTLTLQGLDTAGGDNTAFLDDIILSAAP